MGDSDAGREFRNDISEQRRIKKTDVKLKTNGSSWTCAPRTLRGADVSENYRAEELKIVYVYLNQFSSIKYQTKEYIKDIMRLMSAIICGIEHWAWSTAWTWETHLDQPIVSSSSLRRLPASILAIAGRQAGWNTSSVKQNFYVRWSQTHLIPSNSSSSIPGLKFYGIGYCLMQSTSGP